MVEQKANKKNYSRTKNRARDVLLYWETTRNHRVPNTLSKSQQKNRMSRIVRIELTRVETIRSAIAPLDSSSTPHSAGFSLVSVCFFDLQSGVASKKAPETNLAAETV